MLFPQIYFFPCFTTVGTERDKPSARSGHVLFVAGAYAFVHGGFGGAFGVPPSYLDDTWGLDLRVLPTRKWRRFEPPSSGFPRARSNHAAAVVRTSDAGLGYDARYSVYVFGGIAPGGIELDDLWRYDANDNRWSRLELATGSASPLGRQGHAMAAIGGVLCLHGGQRHTAGGGDPTLLADVWLLDTQRGDASSQAWQWQQHPTTSSSGVTEMAMVSPSHPQSAQNYLIRFAGHGDARERASRSAFRPPGHPSFKPVEADAQ